MVWPNRQSERVAKERLDVKLDSTFQRVQRPIPTNLIVEDEILKQLVELDLLSVWNDREALGKGTLSLSK